MRVSFEGPASGLMLKPKVTAAGNIVAPTTNVCYPSGGGHVRAGCEASEIPITPRDVMPRLSINLLTFACRNSSKPAAGTVGSSRPMVRTNSVQRQRYHKTENSRGGRMRRDSNCCGRSSQRPQARHGFIELLEGRQLLAADLLGDAVRGAILPVQTVYMDASLVGPAPIVLGPGLASDGSRGFVIKAVASGVVEKLVDAAEDRWADVSSTPTSSNPVRLLNILNLRTIREGDRLRWHPDAGIAGRERAFELVGWDLTGRSSQTASPDLPTAPQQLAVAVNSGGVLEVSWKPPASGNPTHYTVTATGGGAARSIVTNEQTAAWPGYDPTASYSFRVVANNAQGSGPAAAVTSQFPEIVQQFDLSVAATADIYAAGNDAVPVSPHGGGTLPPAIVLPAGTGRSLTFSSVTGLVSFNTDPAVPDEYRGQFHGPDGGAVYWQDDRAGNPWPDAYTTDGPQPGLLSPGEAGRPTSFYTDMPSVNGISGLRLFEPDPTDRRVMFLAGVFTAAVGPGGDAPSRLDFSSASVSVPGGRAFTELAPAIDQSFYIGDGLTGDGDGEQQTFLVPDAATHLYFGFLDGSRFIHGPDFYDNNAGTITVSATVVSPEAGLVTAPPVQRLPVGRWQSRLDGLVLEIGADGSFTITPPPGPRLPVSGHWTEADGVVEFRNDANAPVCPNVPGSYRWEQDFVGGLRFEQLTDSCESRMTHMESPFDPLPVGPTA